MFEPMDAKSERLFRKHFAGCEIAHTVFDGTPSLSVNPIWRGVDRPNVGGWGLSDDSKGLKLAARLKSAIESGRAFCEVSLLTDCNQKSYVAAASPILGRTLNADLKRLGY